MRNLFGKGQVAVEVLFPNIYIEYFSKAFQSIKIDFFLANMYFSARASIILLWSVSPIYESFAILPSEPDKLFVLPGGRMRGEACFHPWPEVLLPFLPCSLCHEVTDLLNHRLCVL